MSNSSNFDIHEWRRQLVNESVDPFDTLREEIEKQLRGIVPGSLSEDKEDDKKKKSKPKKKKKEEEPEDEFGDLDLEDLGDEFDMGDEDEMEDLGGGSEDLIPDDEGMEGDSDKILNALKVAFDAAKAKGDDKLTDQIGNTITMFTRTHIVNND